jgi:hypothetical protein
MGMGATQRNLQTLSLQKLSLFPSSIISPILFESILLMLTPRTDISQPRQGLMNPISEYPLIEKWNVYENFLAEYFRNCRFFLLPLLRPQRYLLLIFMPT